jgi:DNA-binding LacI/PurR family transcriptional regulator
MNFLVKMGHKRIAHILGPQSLLTTKERYQGYIDGLKANNLPFDKSLIYSSDLSTGSTIRAVDKLLSLREIPTAIIAFKDYIAIDGMQYIKSLTRRSYRKIEWVGFGNLPMLRYLDNPPLASLEEQSAIIGSRSAELLMKRIRAENQQLPPESIQFDCTLRKLK